ncbi:MAG TPA: glycosyltransferase [Polyangia bacterium]|jgi:glycosyltransferase involved in cell wall biosynthesis|nr:glycosyltransferase [Polyangia bacterium]
MRVLIVTYVFPPTGGAGVGRPLKLVKYLGAHGIQPAVLTTANPSVPVNDHSLTREIPPGTEIQRVRTFEPSYKVKQAGWSSAAGLKDKPTRAAGGAVFAAVKNRVRQAAMSLARQALIPDPQVLWQPAAQAALAGRLARKRDDVVFISAPPFSQFLLAPLCRLRPGVAVVLDYRDEWSTVREVYEMKASLPARAGAALEAKLLRSAHMVTTATEAFRRNLLERFPFLSEDSVVAIPNGYDPEDFPETLAGPPPRSAPGRKFVITYAGTIFRLTSARGFLGGLRRLAAAQPDLAALLDVRFLGRIVETEADAFEGTEALGVRRMGYVPHERVVEELGATDLALCILDEAPFVERIYPAKIFELMYLAQRFGRPCLTLSPPGVLADLVARHQVGRLIPPRDEAQIAAYLAELLTTFRDGQLPPRPAPVGIERFHRRELAGEFAAVFRAAYARAAAGGGAST